MQRVFVWDYYGTLVLDPTDLWVEAVNSYLREMGSKSEVTSVDIERSGFEYNNLHKKLKLPGDFLTFAKAMTERIMPKLEPSYDRSAPGANEALSLVRKRGDRNLVISTTSKKVINPTLEALGLKHYVEDSDILSIYDIAMKIYHGKERGRLFGEEKEKLKKSLIEEAAKKSEKFELYLISDGEKEMNFGRSIRAKATFLAAYERPPLQASATLVVSDLLQVVGFVYGIQL